MLPFSFTTGEAVLYDINPTKSLSGTPSGPELIASVTPGDSNQPKLPGGLDPNSLLGSMLKQDESLYVCHSGSDELMRARDLEDEEEELGGIFSSNWQKNILSLPETSLFKPDPVINSGEEESNCELMSLMGSLGITPEDLQLLQHQDLFLNIDLDGQYGLEDFKDDVFSYVQESLRKKTDFALPSSVQANLKERCIPCVAPQPQPLSQPSGNSWSQGQQLYLHSPSVSQSQQQHSSFLIEPSDPKMQQFIPKQSYSQPQPTPPMQAGQQNPQGSLQAQSHLYDQPQLNSQQQSPHPVNHGHVYQPELSCVPPPEIDVHHRLNHTEVNRSDSVSVTESSSVDLRLPPVLQSGLQQSGSFYMQTSNLPQGHPYMNQLNTVCMNRNPSGHAPSCVSTRDLHVGEYLGELLTCLDSVGQEKHEHPEELNGGSHYLCAQSSLDHSMLQQPYMGQVRLSAVLLVCICDNCRFVCMRYHLIYKCRFRFRFKVLCTCI